MVERFTGSAFDPQGSMVRHSDYADLERQIAELRAKCDAQLAETQRAWNDRDGEKRKRLAAEAENARLKALPLKDEVERVLEEVRNNGLIYWEPNTARGQDRKTAVVERLDALLSHLRAGVQEGWRSMDSAPKDGTNILAAHDQAAIVVYWQSDHTVDGAPGWACGETDPDGYFYTYPVFVWQPLPALPASPFVAEGGSRNG